jgi:hypothetical protein
VLLRRCVVSPAPLRRLRTSTSVGDHASVTPSTQCPSSVQDHRYLCHVLRRVNMRQKLPTCSLFLYLRLSRGGGGLLTCFCVLLYRGDDAACRAFRSSGSHP